jgi:hypothetical protein
MTSVAAADTKTDQLVGSWQGSGTLTLQGKANPVSITYDCTAAGPAVACSVASKGKDLAYNERHLLGYDKASDTYHLFSVNDWGEAYDHSAKWTEAGKASFEYKRGAEREVYTLTFKKDALVIHGTFTRDGKVIGDGEYTLSRR